MQVASLLIAQPAGAANLLRLRLLPLNMPAVHMHDCLDQEQAHDLRHRLLVRATAHTGAGHSPVQVLHPGGHAARLPRLLGCQLLNELDQGQHDLILFEPVLLNSYGVAGSSRQLQASQGVLQYLQRDACSMSGDTLRLGCRHNLCLWM